MKIEQSIVIPFCNEEKNVKYVLEGISKEFKNYKYEIIAVDNASSDNTKNVIKRLAEKNKHIKYLYVRERGYGNAIINGLKKCRGKYLGYGWGDGQMDNKDVIKVFDILKNKNLDLCKVKRINRKDSFYRRLQSFVYNFFYRIIFPYMKFELFGDMNGCPKVFNRKAYKKLEISSKRWFIDTEIMIKANKYKLNMEEIPIIFRKRRSGKSNLRLKVVFEFIKEAINFKLKGY